MGNWQTELTFPYSQYNDYSNSHRWFLQCTKVIYLFYSKKTLAIPPAGNFLSKQQVSATLSTNENGGLNAPFSATHFTWKFRFRPTSPWQDLELRPRSSSLDESRSIRSIHGCPGHKKNRAKISHPPEDLVMYMKDGREMISLEKMHKKHEKRWQ